jgi:FkbM family methyltransferase
MIGTYENSTFQMIEPILKPGDVFVDVGAHAGYYTLLVQHLVKRNGKIISFEPNPSNFKYLFLTASVNYMKNVVLCRAAVSDFNGAAKLYIPKFIGHNSTSEGSLDSHVNDAVDSVDVPVVTLDSISKRMKVQPDVIKIDVEGAEVNVIKGALQTLAKGVKLVVIEMHTPNSKRDIIELLKPFNYTLIEKDRYYYFLDLYKPLLAT